MKKTPSAAKKAEQVREKRAPYVRAPRATARSARGVRADALQPASPQEEASRTIELHGTQVPDDVVQFCEREGVLDCLAITGTLIAKHFPAGKVLDVTVEQDPETGDEGVVIELGVPVSVEALLEQRHSYTRDFVASVPWPQRAKIHLCEFPL